MAWEIPLVTPDLKTQKATCETDRTKLTDDFTAKETKLTAEKATCEKDLTAKEEEGKALRADAKRINRWDQQDRRWLRTMGRDRAARPSKFNAGQKLNAAFTAGSIPVMLATGSIMRWFGPFPLSWRTGATFVHDSMFLALAVVITGHILFVDGGVTSQL